MTTRNLYRKLLLLALLAVQLGAVAGPVNDAGHERAIAISDAGQRRVEPQALFENASSYADNAVVDLDSLTDPADGWTLAAARDISDAGQISAAACRSGECGTVRLDLPVPAVPEPRAWGLLLVGLVLVASRRRAPSAEQTFR